MRRANKGKPVWSKVENQFVMVVVVKSQDSSFARLKQWTKR